jgi:hypothetical protein
MRSAVALVETALLVIAAVHLADAHELDAGYTDPTPSPIALPPGVYLVTDVYAGSIAITAGGTTTYRTLTVRATPGTYARLLDVVGTGVASTYDGRSFNGRARLSDGRPVAGAYYQTYVRTPTAFVPVNVVFFQDDSETRALVAPTPVLATQAPTPRGLPTPARPIAPTASPAPSAPPRPAPTMPPMPVVAAGVALAKDGPTLSSIDVLRGRSVHLWPRAFVDGMAVPVRSWRLVAGSADVLSRMFGSAADPADATWLTPIATPLVLRFEVTTDAAPDRPTSASLTVTVRSPALLQ